MTKNKKEMVHVRLPPDLYQRMETLRQRQNSSLPPINRTDVYIETLFYGERIQQIKKELGDKEFERIWNLINKINLAKINLEKFI